jgi:hypothetical protein
MVPPCADALKKTVWRPRAKDADSARWRKHTPTSHVARATKTPLGYLTNGHGVIERAPKTATDEFRAGRRSYRAVQVWDYRPGRQDTKEAIDEQGLFEGFTRSLDVDHLGVRQSPFATFIDYGVKKPS